MCDKAVIRPAHLTFCSSAGFHARAGELPSP